MENQNMYLSSLDLNELETINGGTGGEKILLGIGGLCLAAGIEYFSGGTATALAADIAYGSIGLIGSGIIDLK